MHVVTIQSLNTNQLVQGDDHFNWIINFRHFSSVELAQFFFFFFSLGTFPQMGRIGRKQFNAYLKPLLGRETRKPGEKPFLGATGGTRTCGLSHHSQVL